MELMWLMILRKEDTKRSNLKVNKVITRTKEKNSKSHSKKMENKINNNKITKLIKLKRQSFPIKVVRKSKKKSL